MAVDELAALHEWVGARINTTFHLFTTPSASFNWVLFFLPLELVAIVALLAVLFRVRAQYRRAWKYLISGFLLMVFVLFIEFFSGNFLYDSGRAAGKGWWYWQMVAVEEFVEMLGVTLLLVGFLNFFMYLFQTHVSIKKEE